ncbi:hypothetical protein [Shewanella dokdonensis]|uniref:hypothetical protein n=1 Tax=Shewanella dokdonensis TaxID=712036 RepID=UPI00313FE64F
MIKPADIIRDNDGLWTHPDLPEWDEGTTKEQVDAWASENGGTIHVEWMDGNAPQELTDRYFEVGEPDCSYWYPCCNKEGNFLLSIHDTEDGPVALFFVPNSSKAVLDVIAERQRQLSVEGWTPDHDDKYNDSELATAALCYLKASFTDEKFTIKKKPDQLWPWASEWWKPANPRRDLVKAAALILAEIERLDRKAAKEAA